MDKVTEVLLDGLRQALAHGEEQRLYRSGKLEGLFPGKTGANGEAAARALREGLLNITRTETRGKTTIDWVRISPSGVDFLHQHDSPFRALSELRETLHLNKQAVPVWLEQMQSTLVVQQERLTRESEKWVERLESLERRVEETLRRIELSMPLAPAEILESYPWTTDALRYLDRRRDGGAPNGCPLPELFTALARTHGLAIHEFHDGLRLLHQRRLLHLDPADDPVSLPQPEFALLDGASVCYHARR